MTLNYIVTMLLWACIESIKNQWQKIRKVRGKWEWKEIKPTQTQTVLNTLADISINAGCWQFIVTYETSNHRLFWLLC